MISVQEIGNQKLYDAIFTHMKERAPFFKKITMKGISKKDAMECGCLELEDLELTDLEFLRFFPNLTALMLSNITGVQSVDGLRNCPKITDIAMFDTPVYDLNGVKYCSHLNSFQYFPNQISDTSMELSFLRELSKLEGVDMVGCNISDPVCFLPCKSLSYLNLSKNPIKSIKPLSELPMLKELDLSGCPLEKLEDLSTFPTLEAIVLHDNLFSEEEKEHLISLYPDIYFSFGNDD